MALYRDRSHLIFADHSGPVDSEWSVGISKINFILDSSPCQISRLAEQKYNKNTFQSMKATFFVTKNYDILKFYVQHIQKNPKRN
jgi:hypothetical protein